MSHPARNRITLLPYLDPGTILSCPQCEAGLYILTKKVTRDGTFEGAAKAMAGAPPYARGSTPKRCPLCKTGEWWYPPGTVHTFQNGWIA